MLHNAPYATHRALRQRLLVGRDAARSMRVNPLQIHSNGIFFPLNYYLASISNHQALFVAGFVESLTASVTPGRYFGSSNPAYNFKLSATVPLTPPLCICSFPQPLVLFQLGCPIHHCLHISLKPCTLLFPSLSHLLFHQRPNPSHSGPDA
jgi:hypothetical protein